MVLCRVLLKPVISGANVNQNGSLVVLNLLLLKVVACLEKNKKITQLSCLVKLNCDCS